MPLTSILQSCYVVQKLVQSWEAKFNMVQTPTFLEGANGANGLGP